LVLLGASQASRRRADPILPAVDDPSLPYAIVAIDYHFHNAHPTLPLASTREVIFYNQGSVVHNVTIPSIGYTKDIPVGKKLVIQELGRELGGPGTYTFYCKYHADRGMSGVIIIA
jgi:hypothetical protein